MDDVMVRVLDAVNCPKELTGRFDGLAEFVDTAPDREAASALIKDCDYYLSTLNRQKECTSIYQQKLFRKC